MHEAAAPALAAWESFYVIVGSSGAALTGLMFVVITLIADSAQRRSTSEIDTFGTPTIVHFCAALLVSAIVSAPWRELRSVAITIGALGGAGIAYVAIIIRRARRGRGYQPVFEDWLWHAILPLLVYVVFLVSAIALLRYPESALFGIGAMALLLLFIGIHNAWDTVTYIAIQLRQEANQNAVKPPRTDGAEMSRADTASPEAKAPR